MKNFSAILLLSIALSASSQNSYQLNSTVNNFTISRLINAPADAGSLKTFQKEITILDFFATWCVPCIKALPNLSSLKNKYPDKLSILLVSTEEEERLKKFVAARNGFVFPVVVDANSSISNLFQPPSFPYTVVLNNENKIIAITDAGSITEADINAWLAGKNETKPASLPASEKSFAHCHYHEQ